MKSATQHIGSVHTEQAPSDEQAHGGSNRVHYVLVAVLLVVAYLIGSMLFSAPGTASLNIGSGFLFFWLCGGLVTLGLLTRAAKQ